VVTVSEAAPNRPPGDHAEPLPDDHRIRWDAFADAIGELPAAIGDAEAFDAAFGALQQISRGLDVQQLADALHVPVDAGEYADGCERCSFGSRTAGGAGSAVAKQLPARALSVADRVAGSVGLGTLKGKPEPYLCHTLCELGAEPLDHELKAIATFLGEHSDQVLVVIVEDYVPPSTVEHAFATAGLNRYLEALRDHAPLPTLGELISSGRRLLVFAEVKGGSPAWYMPAFSFIQDTPLGALHPGQLSCARYRGTPDSPILLLNHWIPPFPPSPTVNAQIGRAPFLRDRISRCTRERHTLGAIVAVDFYERTAVINVAQELNSKN
jgi:hypothetical protein